MAVEIGVYIPQVGLSWDELRARVVECDELGIHSVWFMDHLYPPGLPKVPSFEAWTTAAALAAVTSRVRLGHLVLCNGFRHPALLAKMATTLDHASGGRLNLGLGSGSYPPEFSQFGLDFPPRASAPSGSAKRSRSCAVSSKRKRPRSTAAITGSTPRPACRARCSGRTRRFTSAAPERDGPCLWSRAMPTCGTARRTHWRICPASSTCCAPSAAGSDGTRRRCALRRRRSSPWWSNAIRSRRRGRLAERRFPGPGWGFEAGGYCGTPEDVARRVRERARLGVDGVVFFLHDRGQPETLRLLAREVLPLVQENPRG